jgi:hypothetical protein
VEYTAGKFIENRTTAAMNHAEVQKRRGLWEYFDCNADETLFALIVVLYTMSVQQQTRPEM